jgi:hypothetical protein
VGGLGKRASRVSSGIACRRCSTTMRRLAASEAMLVQDAQDQARPAWSSQPSAASTQCLCLMTVMDRRRTWAAGTGYGSGYRNSKGDVWDARQGAAMQVRAVVWY